MVFVELTPFIAFRQAFWSDDQLRELQNFLLASPDAGKVIRGRPVPTAVPRSGTAKPRSENAGHAKALGFDRELKPSAAF